MKKLTYLEAKQLKLTNSLLHELSLEYCMQYSKCSLCPLNHLKVCDLPTHDSEVFTSVLVQSAETQEEFLERITNFIETCVTKDIFNIEIVKDDVFYIISITHTEDLHAVTHHIPHYAIESTEKTLRYMLKEIANKLERDYWNTWG